MNFALIGNQNSGKTTLFNALTGSNQHVGNFPGVTVDQKIGDVKGKKDVTVTDLPGIYSIRPYSQEETVTRDYLLKMKPDGIINIIDATNIERNLYLTLQLLELRIPTVIALNMMDEVRKNGGSLDIPKLSESIGVPVVPIAALRDEGISELIDKAVETARNRVLPARVDFCEQGPVHRCIHAAAHIIEDHAEKLGYAPRFCATKLIEGDPAMSEELQLDKNEMELLEHSVIEMETETGLDRNEALADMRYTFIEKVVAECVVKCRESREYLRSQKMDKLLTGKYTAIPVFLVVLLLVFFLSFNVIGSYLQGLMDSGIGWLSDTVNGALISYGMNDTVRSLIVDGIFGGVGAVLSFLPIIVTLFFFLSILEDTGYMARVAFIMDKPLRKLGISGRSFVPMLIGFGCTVPAVMATRTLSSDRDRRLTIMLTPYMSCSAKIPVYATICAAFFPKVSGLMMITVYACGILVGILVASILRRTAFRGNPVPFVMELPNYRLPSARNVALLLWDKAKDFLQKAFTVIFTATVIIWFLQKFDTRLNVVTDAEQSLLAWVGRFISPVFKPLGFADWRASTALISGFIAKESVVSTLTLLGGSVKNVLAGPVAAFSFLLFTLLYTPCVAAVAAIKREMGSVWRMLAVVVLQCLMAWAVAAAFMLIAGLF